MWSEKHRPTTLDVMVGNREGREKLAKWLKSWKRGAKAALLVGPPGTGKTTCVHLTAARFGMQLVELNASDTRTKEKLGRRLGQVLSSSNLFGTRSLVFLDEVDGLAGRADYGAVEFIKDAVKKSENPVVMAANDPDADEVRKLASVTSKIEFVKPDAGEVQAFLAAVAGAEGLDADGASLERMAKLANGDLRSAINLLQSGGSHEKDEEVTAAQALNAFFSAMDGKAALVALRSYPGQPREKIRDLFNGILKSRIHEERKAAALDVLSRADVLMGRIMRGQDWRLLRYLDPMLASELWTSLGDGGVSYVMDGVPWLLQLRIWNDSKKLKEIGALAGRRLGISQRGFLVEDMPYFLLLARDAPFREGVIKSLDLEETFVPFLAKEATRARAPS